MPLSMYVAGECEILMSNISRKEFKGIMRLLKKMAYFSSMFEWKRVLQFYAAWVRRIEKGLNLWHDDSSFKTQCCSVNRSTKKQNKDVSQKSGQVWWCAYFNNNKYSVQSATQHKNVQGQSRLVHHICRTCWRNDKKQLQHPENSSACPHKI